MAKEVKPLSATSEQHEQIVAEINVITQIQEIETQLALDPGNYRVAQLAEAYIKIGEYDVAAELCEQNLGKFPDYGTLALVLTETLLKKGDYKKASEVISGFFARHPAHIRAHKILGDIALHENDLRKAAKHFRIALRMDPVNRMLIQTFMEVRDQYNKIKDTLPPDEDEETVKPTLTPAKTPEPVKTELSDQILDEIMPPVKKGIDLKPESRVLDILEKEPEFLAPEPVIKPLETKKTPAVKQKTDIVPEEISATSVHEEEEEIRIKEVEPVQTVSEAMGLKPVYIDSKGKMYFYEDDEVSFDQYKKRFDLLKAGKAVIMPKARLDERLAELGIVITPRPAEKLPEKIKPATKAREIKSADTIEELPPAAVTETEETLSEEKDILQETGEEQALDAIEMSYRDYLDMLTEEDELLEALMGESGEETPAEESSALVSKIVAAHEPAVEPVRSADEKPLSYGDYLDQTEDAEERQAAEFDQAGFAADDDKAISLADFAKYLDSSEETLDYDSYRLLDREVSDHEEPVDLADTEPPISYVDFLCTLQDESEKSEALITPPEEPPAAETTVQEEAFEEIIPVTEPRITAAEEVTPATETSVKAAEELSMKLPAETKAEKIVEKAELAETAAAKEKAEPAPAAIAEKAEEETEEDTEYEEEIDPREASLELVEKLALEGQFGTAYKVCKMLKLKNPTDAKVDRKILELKRLYLWSSQLVG